MILFWNLQILQSFNLIILQIFDEPILNLIGLLITFHKKFGAWNAQKSKNGSSYHFKFSTKVVLSLLLIDNSAAYDRCVTLILEIIPIVLVFKILQKPNIQNLDKSSIFGKRSSLIKYHGIPVFLANIALIFLT